jgi:predicted glycosyltransferase
MNVAVTIQHPAHVHFFRNAIGELAAAGHDVRIFARRAEIVADLLEAYELPYEMLAGTADSLPSLAVTQATYEARLLARMRRFEPDVITAIGGVAAAHVARAVGARSVVFYDTEDATLSNALAFPLAHRVCTPESYRGEASGHHVRYPGYHELAYLHPDRFAPDPSILEEIGIETDEDGTPIQRLVVLRLVAWNAAHDIGATESGIEDIGDAVARLEATGARVLITAEGSLPAAIDDRQVSVPPHRVHHLLYYADVFIGESPTMATEAAVLGTPALYVSARRLGYVDELEQTYGLIATFSDVNRHENALRRAISILEREDRTEWQVRREVLLSEKVDTTDVIVREVTAEGEHATRRSPGPPDPGEGRVTTER